MVATWNLKRWANATMNVLCRSQIWYSSVQFYPLWVSLGRYWKTTKRTKNIWYIINNSAADWSILLKFGTDVDHLRPDVLQMFKAGGSNVKVTAWHNVAAAKTLWIGTDMSTDFKHCENYPKAKRNTWHMFRIIRPNIEIAITPQRIVRFRSHLVQSLTTAQQRQMSKVIKSRSRGKSQGHSVNLS